MVLPFSATEAQTQKGKASFYSRNLTGRHTASGEKCSIDGFTCAHRTYPFGTLLKVTNLDNGNEVVVRVNDRGPYVKSRVVDVSYAAAQQLGMLRSGTCNVKVELADESLEEETSPLFLVDISPLDLHDPLQNPWIDPAVTDKLTTDY